MKKQRIKNKLYQITSDIKTYEINYKIINF